MFCDDQHSLTYLILFSKKKEKKGRARKLTYCETGISNNFSDRKTSLQEQLLKKVIMMAITMSVQIVLDLDHNWDQNLLLCKSRT